MKPLERYTKIKTDLIGRKYNEESLKQYLHIAQVMHEEEKAYRNHRAHMLQWLANIENMIYLSAERYEKENISAKDMVPLGEAFHKGLVQGIEEKESNK